MSIEEMVQHDAEAMLPLIEQVFGDTELLQARRRDALEAEIVRWNRETRRRTKATFLARQAVAA